MSHRLCQAVHSSASATCRTLSRPCGQVRMCAGAHPTPTCWPRPPQPGMRSRRGPQTARCATLGGGSASDLRAAGGSLRRVNSRWGNTGIRLTLRQQQEGSLDAWLRLWSSGLELLRVGGTCLGCSWAWLPQKALQRLGWQGYVYTCMKAGRCLKLLLDGCSQPGHTGALPARVNG